MKPLFSKVNFSKIFIYPILGFAFIIFSFLDGEISLYSTALYAVSLELGASIIFTPLIFMGCFLITGKFGLLLSASIPALLLSITTLIYKKFKCYPKYETALFVALSVIAFIFIGDTTTFISYEKRIFVALLTVLLTLILKSSINQGK